MKIEELLKDSIYDLKKAIGQLKIESDFYYDKNDNMRGNIRYDAAIRLQADLKNLINGKDYITRALKK